MTGANAHALARGRSHWIAFTIVIALETCATFASVSAQTKIAFEQEWNKLIAAAKQEGTLAIASGGQPSRQYRPVLETFSKKFGVKVEMSTGSATGTSTNSPNTFSFITSRKKTNTSTGTTPTRLT